MKRRRKEETDSSYEIGNWFWAVLILTTLACLVGWLAPEPFMGKIMITIAAAVGWYYVIADTLSVRARNKQKLR